MKEDVSNTVCGLCGMNNNSECLCECLFVGAPHRQYMDFRRAFEKYRNIIPMTFVRNESRNVRARGVHTAYCFCDF